MRILTIPTEAEKSDGLYKASSKADMRPRHAHLHRHIVLDVDDEDRFRVKTGVDRMAPEELAKAAYTSRYGQRMSI